MTLVPTPTFQVPPIPPPPQPPVPSYKLFDPTSVGIATFLGSPIAGTVLMAINHRRLGKASAGVGVVFLGVLAVAVEVASGLLIKTGAVSLGIQFGFLAATVALARQTQGQEIEAHCARGGKVASRWAGAGVGLLFTALILGGFYVWFTVIQPPFAGTRLAYGAHDEIYYSGTATDAEARALGDALKMHGYFGESGATVQLDKSGGKTTVSFVVEDGVWDKSDFIAGVKDLVGDVAPAVGGFPITVKLLDSEGDSHKELIVTESRKKRWTEE